MIWIIYIFEEVLILLINNPVIVKIAPRRPIKEIFSCRVKNAKIIVTTGIKYIPKEIFTVPTNLQALFQALKQNPLANNPKNKRFPTFKKFLNLCIFSEKFRFTFIEFIKSEFAVIFEILFPIIISGIIKITAKKKILRVEHIRLYSFLLIIETNKE